MRLLPLTRFTIHSPLAIDDARRQLRRELSTLSGQLLGEFDGRRLFALVDLSIAPLVEIYARLEEWPTRSRATLRGEIALSPLGQLLFGLFASFVGVAFPLFAFDGDARLVMTPAFVVTAALLLCGAFDVASRRAHRVLERVLRAAATRPRARRLIGTRKRPVESVLVPVPVARLRDPYRGRLLRPPAVPD